MLVLSRDIGQEIVIGDELIVIKVVGIEGGHVKIGISAPKELSVDRREVWESKRKERERA
jgi:carbon storage regulator